MLKDPSKPYDAVSNPYTSQMGSKPADFKTTQQLEFSLLGPQMSYDSNVAIDETVARGMGADYPNTFKSPEVHPQRLQTLQRTLTLRQQ